MGYLREKKACSCAKSGKTPQLRTGVKSLLESQKRSGRSPLFCMGWIFEIELKIDEVLKEYIALAHLLI